MASDTDPANVLQFYDKRGNCTAYVTDRTENPDSVLEFCRPFGDGSGSEVVVSLTYEQWQAFKDYLGPQLLAAAREAVR